MALFAYRNGKIVEIGEQEIEKRSPIISDEMPLTWHPVTNRRLSSKSEFRKDTIRSGCREVGNDVSSRPPPRVTEDTPGRKEELSRVYDQLKYGRRD